jgi:hypothetical protein
MERSFFSVLEREADRLFESTPSGLTVIHAAGMQAVAGVGFDLSRFQTQSLVVARTRQGLQVTTHNQYTAAPADCDQSSCVAVFFEPDETAVVRGTFTEEVDVAAHLRAQLSAHDAVGVLAAVSDSSHDPFANTTAAARLAAVADYHTQDTALAMIANYGMPADIAA